MIYLGSERTITQSFEVHEVAEDYGGLHKSEVKINGKGKVIKVINKFISHQDSINYNTFLQNEKKWYSNGGYNCISITGKSVRMTVEEVGGNQVWIETYQNNDKLIFRLCHLDSVFVKLNDIIDSNTVIGLQGNTGLVLSSKSVTDETYGTHVHLEVIKNNQYINPRKYANGEIITTYLDNDNGINKDKNQIKILVQQINIREKADEKSKDIGDVYYNEYYDVLEIVDSTNYTWYKIKTNSGIIGYVASLKNGNWIEYKNSENGVTVTSFKLIFECEKTGQYSIKLNAGEKLYIEKNK